MANWLKVEPQFVNKIKTKTINAQLYLVHRNDIDKYQYNPTEVVANFDYMEKIDGYEPRQRKESIAKRIADWEIKPYNLTKYVSPHEYAMNKPYYDRCFMYYYNNMKTLDRNMQCVFISWKSHTWKTTFAKELASKYWYDCYISSGWKNPLDNYWGQACIILDDLRDKTYELSDFLKLTDNNTDSLIGCRFYNKSISDCKLLIVTSINAIEWFYSNLIGSEWEEAIQLFRRFKTKIEMTKEEINLYNWDNSEDRYIWARTIHNHITDKYEAKVDNPVLEDIITKFWYVWQTTWYDRHWPEWEIQQVRLLIE